ncbi:MAG TPA: DUF4040 domain-containing protein [Gammaproteobacteria bacterium]|nr:DUF4040 domain-containing protein [Gammaproteobacteria bacterium]
MGVVVDISLLTLLGITALTIIRLRSLFAVVMLAGLYSFVSAGLFVVMDAVDVAFTEAAVGAGISTVLMLSTLALTSRRSKRSIRTRALPLLVVLVTGTALIYGTLDMPHYGSPGAPANHHVAPRYLRESMPKTNVPNVVTSVLASYRGYDTLGETTVVFTAVVGVTILLGVRRRRPNRPRDGGDDS